MIIIQPILFIKGTKRMIAYSFQALAIIFITLVLGDAFILNIPKNPAMHLKSLYNDNTICPSCSERVIYKNYLLSLRKIRRTVKTSTILNFTNNTLMLNNTQPIEINTEEIGLKKIMMANMHIDVSNVKYVQISTKKDTIIVELDKKNKLNNILNDISNIDALINTLSLLLKILNGS
jgi:hypothetical protein